MKEIYSNLNQEEIAKAWFIYMKHHVVREDILRSVIARSWKRSPKLDYISLSPVKKTAASIQRKLYKQNDTLIDACKPIMEYLYAIDNKLMVILCEKEGYCINFYHNYGHSITSVDTCYSEEHVGTNVVGIILAERIPVIVSGFEHLKCNWSAVTSGGIPINDSKGNIMGVLSAGYPFYKTPVLSMDVLEYAGEIIEKCLVNNSTENIESTILFDNLLNKVQNGLIIMDKMGRIINVNKKILDMMGTVDKDMFMKESSVGNGFISSLFSKNALCPPNNLFILKTKSASKSFEIINWNIIRNNTNEYILAHLNSIHMDQEPAVYVHSVIDTGPINDIIGNSKEISIVKERIKKVSSLSSTILLQGESGTGKELVARTIHLLSGRKGPFVPVNCGAIPSELLASELFGYAEGSFTGAKKHGNIGKFEAANGGTLFLDEIGEMPLNMQVALLRFLEDKTVVRMGSTKPIHVDTRIIAATNRELLKEVASGKFRQDLYYRLAVITGTLPSLRQIREDIPTIAKYLLATICKELQIPFLQIDNSAIDLLCQYDWPGNVRELRNVMERCAIHAESNIILEDDVRFCLDSHSDITKENQFMRKGSEHSIIVQILQENKWNISQAAKFMGVSRKTLYNMINSQGLEK